MSDSSISFTANPLNRHGHKRQDEAWLKAQTEDLAALFVPFWQDKPLVLPPLRAGEGRDTGWLNQNQAAPLRRQGGACVFLGTNRKAKPLFAVALQKPASELQEMGAFEDLRALAMRGDMPPNELGILAQAKALLHWHERHGFCSVCGAASEAMEGGSKRRCPQCAAEHFPRTDPVVIMLARHRDRCLLGRGQGWPDKMFSALAGFIEPGETLESAVARELEEEAGIQAKNVRYFASQPWPFPASLMIGCMADAANDELIIDQVELEEARWATRAEVAQALAGTHPTFSTPPPMAIAHHLLRAFVDEG